jgi:tryptophan synthase alpha chain
MAVQIDNRYDHRFAELKATGRKAFIPFTLLGWPNREACLDILRTMVESGAAALELGLPFSDPIADGPLIQSAVTETLSRGFRVQEGWELIRAVRELDSEIPIGVMGYYNQILARGAERFFQEAADAGVDGVLVADLPPECVDEIAAVARKFGIALLLMVSPLTTPERIAQILPQAGGFIYVISRLGITGVEARYDEALAGLLTALRAQSNLPFCVGFGISEPEHARKMAELGADGVITGSRIIQLVQDGLKRGESFESVRQSLGAYLRSMVLANG